MNWCRKLQKSHNLLRSLTHQIPEFIFQYRLFPDGRCSVPYASAGIAEMYEVRPNKCRTLHRPFSTGCIRTILPPPGQVFSNPPRH
jgi:hypothetical protein